MTTYSPENVFRQNTRMVFLDDHCYDAEGEIIEVCWVQGRYTTKYFSLYERPGILIQNRSGAIMELGWENALGLISRSFVVGGVVTYPPRDEVLISLPLPTGD